MGWAGLGYGRRVGAMAMQGLIAYYYDAVQSGKEYRWSSTCAGTIGWGAMSCIAACPIGTPAGIPTRRENAEMEDRPVKIAKRRPQN